ncbi:hypothetical protein [Nannocystis sp.]|uniref:hypothetical protein n=1 Tax=Nannocystis sp. TaxID=1962667 RepID=UPI0025FBF900|nr:hypothetical protein [Nannocystis sp.]
MWLMLVAAGALDPEHLPDLGERRAQLAGLVDAGIPAIAEIRHRHVVRPEREPLRDAPGFVISRRSTAARSSPTTSAARSTRRSAAS